MRDKYASYGKSLSPSSAASPLPPRHEGIGLQQLEVSSDALGPAHLGEVLVPGGHCVTGGILGTVSCQFPGARPSGLSGVQCIEAKLC